MSDETAVNKGREFLHDVSNQLLVAHGMGSMMLSFLRKNYPDKEDIPLAKLEKSILAMDKIMTMVEDYRNYLKSIS